MKKKIEKQVWVHFFSDARVSHISWCSGPDATPATLTYEVDEPEQQVTVTENQAKLAFLYGERDDYLRKLGFKV